MLVGEEVAELVGSTEVTLVLGQCLGVIELTGPLKGMTEEADVAGTTQSGLIQLVPSS